MSEVSQNPIFNFSNPPRNLKNNKPTKKIARSKTKNTTTTNNNSTSTFCDTNNNKPLKVVHISNPMRYQVNPAEFRALVQGLTGRDAVVEYSNEYICSGNHRQVTAAAVEDGGDDSNNSCNNDHVQLHHQEKDDHQNNDEVNMSDYFGPSDHNHHHLYQMNFDYFEAQFDDDHMGIMEDLRIFMDDDMMMMNNH